MTGEEYTKLTNENPNVGLVRPFWNNDEYYKNIWKEKNITVLICQRKTLHITQLCLESLLKFYPDIQVLVVDGNSEDNSTLYLRYKSALYQNVKLWERNGLNSHGDTMDEAIRQFINTKYVLLMDSDVITERGGYIEGMLDQFKTNDNLYATGNLMLVTRQNQACGTPYNFDDVLRYAHPCCSVYAVEKYKQMQPFLNHGAPCVNNMIHAELLKYDIGYYPVDKYTSHLSGASWTSPATVWDNDHNVIIRPLITFIGDCSSDLIGLYCQTFRSFDFVVQGKMVNGNFVVHGSEPFEIKNNLFDIRFNVTGEYICEYKMGVNISVDFVKNVASEVYRNPSDSIEVEGLTLYKRKVWQRTIALK